MNDKPLEYCTVLELEMMRQIYEKAGNIMRQYPGPKVAEGLAFVAERLEQIAAELLARIDPDPDWFSWAVELADELGWSRGPVRSGQDADAWTSAELRDRIRAAVTGRGVS